MHDASNIQPFAYAIEDTDPFRPWFWRKFLASVVILFGHLPILSHRCWLQAQKPSSLLTILSIMHRIGNPERKRPPRSEEHTSELQSLMRISYAVFCLTKNNNQHQQHTSITA